MRKQQNRATKSCHNSMRIIDGKWLRCGIPSIQMTHNANNKINVDMLYLITHCSFTIVIIEYIRTTLTLVLAMMECTVF